MSIQVLIVDDDAAVLFLHKLMIEESGFSDNIESFRRAEHALLHLKKRKNKDPECVIFLDINLPGMSGWDFLNKLEDPGFDDKIYVVMVTSSMDNTDQITAGRFKQVIGYFEKPLNLDVCEALKQHEKMKHLFA